MARLHFLPLPMNYPQPLENFFLLSPVVPSRKDVIPPMDKRRRKTVPASSCYGASLVARRSDRTIPQSK